MQSLSTEFNRGVSEAVKWCAALEGNVDDRSLIVELELSKKYGVAEGSPLSLISTNQLQPKRARKCLQSLSTEFNRGARSSSSSSESVSGFKSYSEADKWGDALEGNVYMIAELEMSKKYGVVEGSPCDGGHSCPIEGEPNID